MCFVGTLGLSAVSARVGRFHIYHSVRCFDGFEQTEGIGSEAMLQLFLFILV